MSSTDLGELSEPEIQLVQQHRAQIAAARLATERQLEVLMTAAKYAAWLVENNREDDRLAFETKFSDRHDHPDVLYGAVQAVLASVQNITKSRFGHIDSAEAILKEQQGS